VGWRSSTDLVTITVGWDQKKFAHVSFSSR